MRQFIAITTLVLASCNLFEASERGVFEPTDMPADTAPLADEGGDSGPDLAPLDTGGLDGGSTCRPESTTELCVRMAAVCGSHTFVDNCGASREGVVCGACADGEACNTAGACGCAPELDIAMCDRLVIDCGTRSDADNCGEPRTVDCGGCTAPATCGGGGTPNVCACPGQTDVDFCASQGAICGAVTALDACGQMRTVGCGTCTPPEVCGGNTCACPAESDVVFCARVGGCGIVTADDNCGQPRSASCGGCPGGETCSGNICVCAPEDDAAFCARLNACGALSAVDNCMSSRSVDCGVCGGGEQCSNNQCACVPEDDATFCGRLGLVCGSHTDVDNCAMTRTVADCGACAPPLVCSDGACIDTFPPAGIDTWLRADEGLTLNMQGNATSWADRLSGELWEPPAQNAAPTLITTAHLGFDTLRFFGGGRLVRASTPLTSTQFTAFMVLVRATTNREGPFLATSSSALPQNELTFGTTDTTVRFESVSAGLSTSATVLPTSILAVVAVRAGATNFDFYQNGVVTVSTPHTAAGDYVFDQVGGLEDLRFFRGDLYELMLWPRALSASEVDAVTQYLRSRYSL